MESFGNIFYTNEHKWRDQKKPLEMQRLSEALIGDGTERSTFQHSVCCLILFIINRPSLEYINGQLIS